MAKETITPEKSEEELLRERVDGLKAVLETSKDSVLTLADEVAGLSRPSSTTGIVVAIFPNRYDFNNLNEGDGVYCSIGANAGRRGTITSTSVEERSVTAKFGRDTQTFVYPKQRTCFDLQERVETISEDGERLVEYKPVPQPFYSDYRPGNLLLSGEDTFEIQTLPDNEGWIYLLNQATEEISKTGLEVYSPLKPVESEAGRVYVATGGGLVFATIPEHLPSIEVGATVRLNGFGAITEIGPITDLGSTGTFKKAIDNLYAEVEVDGKVKIVFHLGLNLKKGDRFVLDKGDNVIVRRLESDGDTFIHSADGNVSWDDIIGLDNVKKMIKEVIEYPFTHPELFKLTGKRIPKGALLAGPPGVGKTMVAKALAKSLNDGREGGFLSIRGPEILTMWVGESERKVRAVFETAAEFKKNYDRPAVIFVDDADSLMKVRGEHHGSGVFDSVLTQFLTMMDGVEESSAFVLVATNRPDILDPAITRPGRCDRKIWIERPNEEETIALFEHYLRKVPTHPDLVTELSQRCAREVFSDSSAVAQVSFKDTGVPEELNLSAWASGALVSGIVDKAATAVFHKIIETRDESLLVDWVDLQSAILETAEEHSRLNMDEVLASSFGTRAELIKGVSQIQR